MKIYVKMYGDWDRYHVLYVGTDREEADKAELAKELHPEEGGHSLEVWEDGKLVGIVGEGGEYLQDDMFIYIEEIPDEDGKYVGYVCDKDLTRIPFGLYREDDTVKSAIKEVVIGKLRDNAESAWGFRNLAVIGGEKG